MSPYVLSAKFSCSPDEGYWHYALTVTRQQHTSAAAASWCNAINRGVGTLIVMLLYMPQIQKNSHICFGHIDTVHHSAACKMCLAALDHQQSSALSSATLAENRKLPGRLDLICSTSVHILARDKSGCRA